MPQAKQARTTKSTPSQEPTQEGLSKLQQLAEETKGKSVYAKIAAVQHHVGAVEKTGEVRFGNTKFSHMQEHGLIENLRHLCRAVGLGYFGGATDPGSWTQNGNVWVIDYALTVFDVDTGHQVIRYFPNVGVDNADKGLNKAYTGAMKYALQKFFSVPTEGIDDNETIDTQARAGAAATGNGQSAQSPTGVPATDIVELRNTIGAQPVEFHQKALNQLKTFGVDNIEQLAPADFLKFGQWVETAIATPSS